MNVENTMPRSAGQSFLRDNHKNRGHLRHSNTSQGLSRSSFQRTPLRTVSNNATLLRSPGALESMLKTTTQTGDIGLFTFGANVSATYDQPPRPRPPLPSVPLVPPVRSQCYKERDNFQDDRTQLPSSYRDTTSEILSLYGSEAYQSRAFTPSNDEAQRSYSLTTCSSRHIPSQKSSATLQSLSSASGLQRPRSPFPYPTRLKRPGLRPVSPAVTDNGATDYTRMAEVDRSFLRPVPGDHRPAHIYGSRRPPPLSQRSEVNRSTTSLPARSSPGSYGMSPSHYRSRTPTSYRARTSHPPSRPLAGSSEQGLRSPSLTSIVEMYHRPATANSHVPPMSSIGSFYYDYSEGFEKDSLSLAETEVPLCPIPQRAPSLSRPMVLRAEEKGNLDETGDDNEDEKHKSRIGPISEEGLGHENAPGLEQHAGAHNAIPLANRQAETADPGVEMGHPRADNTGNSQSIVKAQRQTTKHQDVQQPMVGSKATNIEDEKYVEPSDESDTSRVPDVSQNRNGLPSFGCSALGTTVLSPGKRCRRSKTTRARVNDSTNIARVNRGSYSSLRRLRNTLDPNLFEFASLLTSFDRLAKSPVSKRVTSRSSSEETKQLSGHASRAQADEALNAILYDPLEGSPTPKGSEATEEFERPFHKRHKRNVAASRFSTTNITLPLSDNLVSEDFKESPVTSTDAPFPLAYQLEVKKSIPQLMKALPPLPAEAESYGDDGCPVKEITKPSKEPHLERESENTDDFKENYETPGNSTHHSPPKLKLRVKPLPSTPVPCRDGPNMSLSEQRLTTDNTGSPAQRKLKIKISRNAAIPTYTGKKDTVLRSPALKQCNSLADLDHCAQKDIFTNRSRLQHTYSETSAELQEDGRTRLGGLDIVQTAAQIHAEHPVPAKTNIDAQRSPPSSRTGIHRARSMVLAYGQDEHHRLRQKLSFLRLRIGADQDKHEPNQGGSLFPFGIRGGPDSSPALSPETDLKKHQPTAALLRSSNAKRRIRRWAKGAKSAMRRAMRKTLDRSTRLAT